MCRSPSCFYNTDAQYGSLLFPATDDLSRGGALFNNRVIFLLAHTQQVLFNLHQHLPSLKIFDLVVTQFWVLPKSSTKSNGSQQPADKPNENTAYELSNNSYLSKKKGPYDVSNDSSLAKKKHIFPIQAPQIGVQHGLG